jgi:SAM-dependent methyltransferase
MAEVAPSLFVDAWETYRKIVTGNHMFHREIGAELHDLLHRTFEERPFSMLDLGCGDAATIVPMLRGLTLSRYKGVDLSEPALALAADNLKDLRCPVDLERADISIALAEDLLYDVIHISFALHHLTTEQKGRFFRLASERLAEGGLLLLVDVVREEDETLDLYYEHYCARLRADWTTLDTAEREVLCEHIVENDLPEPYSLLRAQAEVAGLVATADGAKHGWHRLMSYSHARAARR